MSRRVLRGFHARPVLLVAALVGLIVYLLCPTNLGRSARAIIAWDLFVIAYLAAMGWVMLRSGRDDIRRRAALYDEGAIAVLTLSVAAAIASIMTVIVEMTSATPADRYGAFQIGLTIATVALSWAFVHTIFALHYAHDFYGECAEPPLHFPGEPHPLYGDFMYFSFVIGCACATADVDIRARDVRRIAAIHGVIAFFFNTAVLALSINIAAGLIGK
jgi:uncharacterized membrane protein